MSKVNDASNRTLTLKKVINAPVRLVWEAWTNPEHVVQWWTPIRNENKCSRTRLQGWRQMEIQYADA